MSNPHDIPERDRRMADSGWGIKPDDQPASAAEAGHEGVAEVVYDPSAPDFPGEVEALRQILRKQRQLFTTANRVRVAADRVEILDIHGDTLIVRGLGYGSETVIEMCKALGAAFSPAQLRLVPVGDERVREYELSRSWAWGAERSGG